MKTTRLLLPLFTLLLSVNTMSQTNATMVRGEYVIKGEYNKRKIVGRIYDKINLISNDTLSFVKMQIKDEYKSGNNGYIYLSNQNEVDKFIKDLNICISKLVNNEVYETPAGKYKLEVKVVRIKKGVAYAIILNETIGGNAYVSLNESETNLLLGWLKNIKL